MTEQQIFLQNVLFRETADCINWPYSGNGAGYGKLHWGDKRDNALDAIAAGRDVRVIRADARLQYEIASDYGISQGCVSSIKSRKIWKHLQRKEVKSE